MEARRLLDITPWTGGDVAGAMKQRMFERVPEVTGSVVPTEDPRRVFVSSGDDTTGLHAFTGAVGGPAREHGNAPCSSMVIGYSVPAWLTLASPGPHAGGIWGDIGGVGDSQWVLLNVAGLDQGASVSGVVRRWSGSGIWSYFSVPESEGDASRDFPRVDKATYYGSFPIWRANRPKLRSIEARAVGQRVLHVISELRKRVATERAPWADDVDKRAFGEATQFVRAWSREPVHMPDVGVADDGEVNFLWKQGGVHVDLGFYGDGTYSYYARDRQDCPYERDDLSPADGLTEELLSILAPLF